MANTDHSPETYAFAQAVASFEAARKDEVPSDWEEYVKSNKGDDTIKIWRKRDSAVRTPLCHLRLQWDHILYIAETRFRHIYNDFGASKAKIRDANPSCVDVYKDCSLGLPLTHFRLLVAASLVWPLPLQGYR